MYTYICVCVYIHIYIYIHLCVYLYLCIFIYILFTENTPVCNINYLALNACSIGPN